MPRAARAGLLQSLEQSEIDSPDVGALLESLSTFLKPENNQSAAAKSLDELIGRVQLRDDGISITLGIEIPCSRAGISTGGRLNLSRFVPLKMKRRGVETRIIISPRDDLPRKVDPALLKAVARSRAWFDDLATGRVRSLADIGRREGIATRYVERLSRLAFVAPSLVEAIMQGRQPAELSTESLLNRIDLPLRWSMQSAAVGNG